MCMCVPLSSQEAGSSGVPMYVVGSRLVNCACSATSGSARNESWQQAMEKRTARRPLLKCDLFRSNVNRDSFVGQSIRSRQSGQDSLDQVSDISVLQVIVPNSEVP